MVVQATKPAGNGGLVSISMQSTEAPRSTAAWFPSRVACRRPVIASVERRRRSTVSNLLKRSCDLSLLISILCSFGCSTETTMMTARDRGVQVVIAPLLAGTCGALMGLNRSRQGSSSGRDRWPCVLISLGHRSGKLGWLLGTGILLGKWFDLEVQKSRRPTYLDRPGSCSRRGSPAHRHYFPAETDRE
jgi:hypothetical protein